MKNAFIQLVAKLIKLHKNNKRWQRAVRVMGAMVVFCTTYALILPAITMETETLCGMEEHVHVQECYSQQEVYKHACVFEEGTEVLHTHNEFCYDPLGNFICTLTETDLLEDIRTQQTAQTMSEDGHVHTDDCLTELVLVCEKEETEGHKHGEGCVFDTVKTLVCDLEEGEEHAHEDACYENQQTPCTLQEVEAHHHSDACYERKEVECPLPEGPVEAPEQPVEKIPEEIVEETPEEPVQQTNKVIHNHTAECLVLSQEDVLVCELPEHTHEEACFPVEETEDTTPGLLCAMGEHKHGEGCWDEAGELICNIPEHTHDASCMVADLDLTADVETQAQWEEMLKDIELTGNWPKDVLAVAESQLGYRESVKNVILENGQLMGYTRYGDWYGVPYGDWCAMYASFCLHYAGVEDFPLEAGVGRWIQALEEQELYKTPDIYTAKPGDLIFFDFDQKRDEEIPVDPDHVGFVVEHIPATETEPAKLKTIEGNTGDAVAYVTYELDDPDIIGYGCLPAGKNMILQYQGPDYLVTVEVSADAGVAENAQLAVQEILPGTEEYETYYQQSVAALLEGREDLTEEDLAISFARYFDITILVDGQKVEPTKPVNITISYTDGIEVQEGDAGKVVHFADDGAEVLPAQTDETAFQFVQDSFSVSGTLLAAEVSTVATRVHPYDIDNTGRGVYVLYTQIGNNYYALDGNGNPVRVTVSGNTVTLPSTNTTDLFWSFIAGQDSGNYEYINIGNMGTGRYLHPFFNSNQDQGVLTADPWVTGLVDVTDYTFRIEGRGRSNRYLRFNNATSAAVQTSTRNNGSVFNVASVGNVFNVWFDGTNGGMMSYHGAANENIPVFTDGNTAQITLPETWQSSTKYDYTLKGWYDINSHVYYPVDPTDDKVVTATINGSTVFYADWIAATYDVGQKNEHTVESLDTSNFITTRVFDYNVLFNVLSQQHTGTITAAGHKEDWTILNNAEAVPYNGEKSLGFAFVDYDADGEFSYARSRNVINTNQGDEVTPDILDTVKDKTGKDLIDLLFNPNTEVIGKHYVGQGNYLYQYMDSNSDNYDGQHDGYYYLDARLNAASYTTVEGGRFYLYDYLERTSDSRKDGGDNPVGMYSDFLPFNSPYLFESYQLDEYTDPIRTPGYEYDAKDGGTNYPNYNSLDDANTNYFFGFNSDIEFFLPNDSGQRDEYGNYGNISTRGQHMVFDFHGDDDVWVFIDDELVLDIGGLHGIMHGRIDFSTGTVTTGRDGGTEVTQTFSEILGHNITEGTHTMSIYYMERGSSQSNCAIYFNIAPRYDLEITKEDIVSAEHLDGAVFSIFTDEAMQHPAQLWESEKAHDEDMKDGEVDDATNTFTVVDGVAKCWGISAGKTYYIYETTPPPGYPESDDMIRITLNNRGTATIETTTLHGKNDVATEGFAVIKQDVNDTLKIVALTVTNQKEGRHTEVRVEKTWDEDSADIPQNITVILTADGVPIGRRAVLSESNGWSYTWTGLDKYRAEGIDEEIVYAVQEVLVPGYITTQDPIQWYPVYVDWSRVDQMSDSKTFLLVHNGQALGYDGSKFIWMSRADAEKDANVSAQWTVTTDHDGFHLKNGNGYTLTYGANGFYCTQSDAVALNQVFYYLNSRLVVHDHDVYYQFGNNGAVVSNDGLAFTLYQKESMTGFVANITNSPVDEAVQTYVEVVKYWEDGYEVHAEDSVVIHLWADGKDTGREITLNAGNSWRGGFYELPYYQTDGETVINYTVVEDPIHLYHPEYSEPQVLPGLPVTAWRELNRLNENNVYMFTASGNALAESNGVVVSELRNTADMGQRWKVVRRNQQLILQNVGSNKYLALEDNNLVMVTAANSATAVSLDGSRLKLGNNRYLELGYGYTLSTGNAANATNLSIVSQVQVTGQPGTGYTVLNSEATYLLPSTGGKGAFFILTFGSLLLAATALVYTSQYRRKHAKGGRRG